MSSLDAQILELFRQLNAEQREIVLFTVVLTSLASEQEEPASDTLSDPAHTA